jgi:hypothetical protein
MNNELIGLACVNGLLWWATTEPTVGTYIGVLLSSCLIAVAFTLGEHNAK